MCSKSSGSKNRKNNSHGDFKDKTLSGRETSPIKFIEQGSGWRVWSFQSHFLFLLTFAWLLLFWCTRRIQNPIVCINIVMNFIDLFPCLGIPISLIISAWTVFDQKVWIKSFGSSLLSLSEMPLPFDNSIQISSVDNYFRAFALKYMLNMMRL